MRLRTWSFLAAALVGLFPAVSGADLGMYGQDFEAMIPASPTALSADGWLVYGNVFLPDGTYSYGYGPYPAPNSDPPAFSRLATGEGGGGQGAQQLSVFSDYENAAHGTGNLVEANVFREQTIGAADVGTTWYFEFDAKRGNLAAPTTALAFIKTLNPAAGYALTNFLQAHMTYVPDTWRRYALRLTIDAGLVGQILQFGFASTATNYDPSGVFYDNVEFKQTASLSVPAGGAGGGPLALSVLGNPASTRSAHVVSFTLSRATRVIARVFDVEGRHVATLADGDLDAGPHRLEWRGMRASGIPAGPGVYFLEVAAGNSRETVKLQRIK
jgi:hypothetical protein